MAPSSAEPKSATQFFEIPKSKKSQSSSPASSARSLPMTPVAPKSSPSAAALRRSVPGAAPPGASTLSRPSPPTPSSAPPPAPPSPSDHGGPVPISGPVAAGAGSLGGRHSPFQVGAPGGPTPPDGQRGRSLRIYAIILALFFVCFLAMVSGVVAVVIGAKVVGSEDQVIAQADEPRSDRTRERERDKQPEPDTAEFEAPPPPPPPPPRRNPIVRNTTPKANGGNSNSSNARVASSAAAPGSIAVSVSGQTFLAIEIKCPNGTRKRAAFSGSSATAQGIPSGQDCELLFKGGLPAKYRPVRSGRAYSCTFQESTAICKG